jgi:hypothetical protein
MHSLHTMLTVLALAGSVPVIGAAAEPIATADSRAIGGPRVRPYDGRSAALFLEGMRRSETFRALVDQIEARDVIVYLQMEPSLDDSLAGMLTWLTATPHFRYVRVSLNPALNTETVIAVLGHELQHALEVATEPSIIDADSLSGFYERTGIRMSTHDNGWDTVAARTKGREVRRDLSGSRVARATELPHPFNALEWHIVYNRARESMR